MAALEHPGTATSAAVAVAIAEAAMVEGSDHPNVLDQKGRSRLFHACRDGQAALVSRFLADPRSDLTSADRSGWTPLCSACFRGHADVAALLLADPRIQPAINFPQISGATPLYVACQNGHAQVVALLLRDGRADVNRAEDRGASPLSIACQNGHVEVVMLLLQDPRCDPNQQDRLGLSPLWVAFSQGHVGVVKRLLCFGRSVDLTIDPLLREFVLRFVGDRGKEILEVIEDYRKDPARTIDAIRKEFKLPSLEAGNIFVLVVMVCDGFLHVAPSRAIPDGSPSVRFLRMLQRFPIEIQMKISNLSRDRNRDFIPSAIATEAIKSTFKLFL